MIENDRARLVQKRRACERALDKATNQRVVAYEELRLADLDLQIKTLDRIKGRANA